MFTSYSLSPGRGSSLKNAKNFNEFKNNFNQKPNNNSKPTQGTSKVVTTNSLADDVARALGGHLSPAKGKGYKIEIPNGRKPITVRVMEAGSGGRSKPYFRVSIDGKGSLTLDGKLSNDPKLTHIDLTENSLKQIEQMIKNYKGK
ncbi:hypothetical protein P4S95_26205 [Aneurinibacillus aneurinilyticus]|uniref:hypothetical protein n=1 Tax=Aneurinibacillus aneurinilyticus TaxID=1391 RepID=UPI002E23BCFD|nr:hypothetical protein [Aneurinibacillus aneurinilyticus]